ncbi:MULTISPECIES: DUF938 domain-containing protein [unclassified Synechococcus]|uniref:DUF938 domain-containing protein n=1 Tax=unclassified Synechococcus TaxID=2626047 RepID=UPI001CF89A5F|nr:MULTISPECIES: DUF938 domain-containing protein [unclassified Synechococcus]MCB4399326.1 DUF938 domain-containing protein [Synechococcus sp. MU1625]MCB4410465.1 DUF938 domain-containing protein [Synechococcus sp. MU1611]
MDQRLFFPATERNRRPIGDLLSQLLPAAGAVLELASGSGEHAVCFQQRFTNLLWQASDPDPDHRASIDAWIRHQGLSNVMPAALNLDVEERPWPLPQTIGASLSAVVCINLLHISPANCTNAVLEESAVLLPSGAPLIIYGPFMRNGAHTSASNAAFDRSLRERNNQWGLREVSLVTSLAANAGFKIDDVVPMPANNLTLVLRRR